MLNLSDDRVIEENRIAEHLRSLLQRSPKESKLSGEDILFLKKCLSSKDEESLRAICETLEACGVDEGEFGSKDFREVLGKLSECFFNLSPEVRIAACKALASLGLTMIRVEPNLWKSLIACLTDGLGQVRREAGTTVAALNIEALKHPQWLVNIQLNCFKDRNIQVRRGAFAVLGESIWSGKGHEALLSKLKLEQRFIAFVRECLLDADELVQKSAKKTLEGLGLSSKIDEEEKKEKKEKKEKVAIPGAMRKVDSSKSGKGNPRPKSVPFNGSLFRDKNGRNGSRTNGDAKNKLKVTPRH